MGDLHKLLYNYNLKIDVVSHKSKETQRNKFLISKEFFSICFEIFWELQK